MGRGPGKKDKFADLEQGFSEMVAGATEEKIGEEIKKAALYGAAMHEACKADQDFLEKKALAKEAGAVYSEAKKQTQLKIAFCRDTLRARGLPVPGDTRTPVPQHNVKLTKKNGSQVTTP